MIPTDATIPCPICATPLAPTWRACPGCGTALTWREGQPVPRPTATPVAAPVPPAPTPKRRSLWPVVGGLVLLLCALGALGNLLNPARPSASSPDTGAGQATAIARTMATARAVDRAATPVPVETPILLRGSGIMKTPPFFLSGGAYSVAWTAKATGTGGCFHGGAISAVDPNVFFYEPIGDKMVQTALAGTTNLYNVQAGQYYLNMSSGCDWTVTIHR